MHRTNIYLDDEQLRALKHLAAEDQCSVAELVRRAVDSYIATRLADDDQWRERLDDFVARVRAQAALTAEEVDADILAAREETRLMRRASSSR